MFKNLRQDCLTCERAPWRQGLSAMAVYRFGQQRYGLKPRIIGAPFSLVHTAVHPFVQILPVVTNDVRANSVAVGTPVRILPPYKARQAQISGVAT